MNTIENLKNKLICELNAVHVEIIDDSWKHAGHAEARPGLEATHLTVLVVSPRFEGVNMLDQHRLVHGVLKEARETHLHALQLQTLTPQVWQQQTASR